MTLRSMQVAAITGALALVAGVPVRAVANEGDGTDMGATPSAAPAGSSATLSGDWSDPYGVLFSLNNIFQNSGFLSAYRGYGAGVQMNLDPSTAIRIGASLSHTSDPVTITKVTAKNGADTVVTYNLAGTGGPTSTFGTSVGADYLMRLTSTAVAPYVGGGVRFDWLRSATTYEDDLTVPDQTTKVDNVNHTMALQGRGILGMEWRVHQRFSLYAEYNLGINLVQWISGDTKTTVENTVGGVTGKSETKTEASETRFLNYDLGLGQGASLGVVGFF